MWSEVLLNISVILIVTLFSTGYSCVTGYCLLIVKQNNPPPFTVDLL